MNAAAAATMQRSKPRTFAVLRRHARAIAATACLAWTLSAPAATPPQAPSPTVTRLDPAKPLPGRTIGVLTLNLWHDKGDWPKRRALIVDEIRRLRPDLIALQEVLQRPGLRNQAEDLGEALGYRVRFVSVDADDAPRRYGNAILFRDPAFAQDTRKLAPLDDYRTAARVRIVVDALHGDLSFYATHLHNERDGGDVRRRQVADLLDFVDSAPGGATVIAGDFNSDADSSELAALTARYRDAYAHAHPDAATDRARSTTLNPAYLPAQRIDHVFYDPARFDLLDARIVLNHARDGVWPSDHFGLYVRLRPRHPVDPPAPSSN